eukprot:COSAG06_NODE_30368_length_540_cov_0.700680_1_plen_74_part_10
MIIFGIKWRKRCGFLPAAHDLVVAIRLADDHATGGALHVRNAIQPRCVESSFLAVSPEPVLANRRVSYGRGNQI